MQELDGGFACASPLGAVSRKDEVQVWRGGDYVLGGGEKRPVRVEGGFAGGVEEVADVDPVVEDEHACFGAQAEADEGGGDGGEEEVGFGEGDLVEVAYVWDRLGTFGKGEGGGGGGIGRAVGEELGQEEEEDGDG